MFVNYMCKKLNVNIFEVLFNDKLIKVYYGVFKFCFCLVLLGFLINLFINRLLYVFIDIF